MSDVTSGPQKQLVASGTVKISGSAIVAATTVARGCVAARQSAGVVTLTLNQAAPAAETQVCIYQRTAGSAPTVADTSDTVKTVSTFAVDGTTATDKNFDFDVFVYPPQ